MIVEALTRYKASKIKQQPINSNRASEMGHECLRYLVLLRTKWSEKTLHDVRLQFIFDEGNMHERAMIRDLQDSGLDIIEQQRAFEWKEYQITGHIDAKILYDGAAVPIEIKGLSPYSWDGINTVADMAHHKRHYIRKYPSQLTLYLLMDNKEEGYFILKNKLTGQPKEIRVPLDYDLGERLIQKAEAVNKHVADGTLPEHCEYSEDVCGECGFIHVCLPEIKRDALDLQTDPEIEADLDRYHELKPMKAEYDKLDKALKEKFKEQPKVLIGSYLVQGKWVEKKGFAVQDSRYWRTNISRLEE